MQQIEVSVDTLDAELRQAVYIEQLNRQGPTVWRNPRAGDRQPHVYEAARTALTAILLRRGVLAHA